jgi:hypothetical protein
MRLKAEMEACRRRSERRQPRAMATFGHGLDRILVEITDLSLEGLRIASPVPVLPGTHIWLKMPLLACREAVVVWCDGEEMGCELIEPLHPMMFDTLTRARADERRLMPGRRDNDRIVASLELEPPAQPGPRTAGQPG